MATNYDWTDTVGAVCISAIRHGDPDVVLAALQATRDSTRHATFADAERAWSHAAILFQLWTIGDVLVVVEPNGYRGSLPDTLLAMAAGRDAVSVFWNVNALMRVTVTSNDRVVRAFDPLMYDEGGEPLPEEDGLPFGEDEGAIAASLGLLERRLGVSIDARTLLETSHPTYVGRAGPSGAH